MSGVANGMQFIARNEALRENSGELHLMSFENGNDTGRRRAEQPIPSIVLRERCARGSHRQLNSTQKPGLQSAISGARLHISRNI